MSLAVRSEAALSPIKLAHSAAVDSHGCYPVGHAVGIEPVSKMCLSKTGIFQSMRGDFCRHTQRKRRVGHTETNTVSEKPAVCGLFATLSQVFEITELFGCRGRIRTATLPIAKTPLISQENFAFFRGFWAQRLLHPADAEPGVCTLVKTAGRQAN